MDLEIRRLTEKIVGILNDSNIPIEVKRYVLKDIYLQVEAKAEEIIRQEEAEERNKQKQAKEKAKGEAE